MPRAGRPVHFQRETVEDQHGVLLVEPCVRDGGKKPRINELKGQIGIFWNVNRKKLV